MQKQMTLENYKKQIEEWLLTKLKLSTEVTKSLMKEYETDFQEFYENNWKVPVVCSAMMMGY